jgi:methylenetetrahydrofolate reductase (NADPH)
MKAVPAPEQALELKRRIVQFVAGASTEITPHDGEEIVPLANALPPRTIVYVAHTPKASLGDVVGIARRVQASGLRASPHIVARRIASERALRSAAQGLRDSGVDRALVIAGDTDTPAGGFSSSLELLETGVLTDAGFTTLGVAGHPEGHRAIDTATLWRALLDKQAFVERAGISMHIVTQFGFDPAAICRWARQRDEQGVRLPVRVGMAGPTPLSRLLKYAVACGVGNSLRGALRSVQTVRRVAGLATTPEAMLVGLTQGCYVGPGSPIEHPHLYSFGGALPTARWLRAVIDGRFELGADGTLKVEV